MLIWVSKKKSPILSCLKKLTLVIHSLFIPNRKNWGADILRECSSPTMCHMSQVTCHMSGVRCQVSVVKCHFFLFFLFFFFFLDTVAELVGGGSVINRIYFKFNLCELDKVDWSSSSTTIGWKAKQIQIWSVFFIKKK